MSDLAQQIAAIGRAAKNAATELAQASTEQKNAALNAMADQLLAHQEQILAANQQDIAEHPDLSAALIDRLTLTTDRIASMANGLREIARYDDPVGRVLEDWQRPNGLSIRRVSVPLGVLAVIYESRPNVTADAAGLAIKSGNTIILRGGSESHHSSNAIFQCLQTGLSQAELPTGAIQMVPTSDRAAVGELLKLDQYIDVLIPRGGPNLIARVSRDAKMPVFKHLSGICHTYVHEQATLEMAVNVVLNAKMRRPGICGATETVLIDSTVAESHLPAIVESLRLAGCEVRGCPRARAVIADLNQASEEDWDSEYLAAIVAVKVVDNIDEAIAHIAKHGSSHTDAIITDNQHASEYFLQKVDSAIVMHNASTQFADGGEFGMGAEIGIATGRLHARGPIGVAQLTTFHYQVRGTGQIR